MKEFTVSEDMGPVACGPTSAPEDPAHALTQSDDKALYSMKDVCESTGLSYDTVKFYCKEGLVPGVKRDSRNFRVFDHDDLSWRTVITYLRRCGMSIADIHVYLGLCLKGKDTVPARQAMLARTRTVLEERRQEIDDCLAYLDTKNVWYQAVLDGRTPYVSHLTGEGLSDN